MTDTDTPPEPGSAKVGTTSAPAPAETSPPASADPAGLESMTPEQLDALSTRIEQTRKNRPPSLAAQLEAIQQQLTETGQQQQAKIGERDGARKDVQELDATISELRATLRRTELVEAANAAGFKSPDVIAEHLKGREGDVTALVTELAATGAFAMRAPANSAPIGGPGSQTPKNVSPGVQGLIDEINRAHGRI